MWKNYKISFKTLSNIGISSADFERIMRMNGAKYPSPSGWNFESTCAIYVDTTLVGFIDVSFSSSEDDESHKDAYLETIDLFTAYRNKGVGKAVIASLFSTNWCVVDNIVGTSDNQTIAWWHSIGARFMHYTDDTVRTIWSKDRVQELIASGGNADFKLKREHFFEKVK